MSSEPQIKLMPYSKRQRFFFVLCVIFALLLPAMIFYTTGYRIDLDNTENRIVTTGGIYITTDNLEVDVYLDDEQVRRPRLFRSAYYIQNIESGMHRVVVQQDELQTWVKDLPVDPYIVIEAAAFNMPEVPHIRLIPQYTTATGTAVYFAKSTSTPLFPQATTSDPYLIATSSATTSLSANPEYEFVASLFSTSTPTNTSVFDRILAEVDRFRFSTTSNNDTATTATSSVTTPIEKGNIKLVEEEGEIVANWVGSAESVPYYYCVSNTASSTIAERYGQHVARQIEEQRTATSSPLISNDNRLCRRSIQIDRKQQDVYFYDFVPTATDLVLLKLEDGLYVSEIDDRSWQNTQLVYPGTDYGVLINNDSIYIQENGRYFELLIEIEEE